MAELLVDFDTGHCGAIHDAQLDNYGQCLATASADGHVRLWDVRKPEEPGFLADLGGHAGAVRQVAWAPIEVGVLLATVGSDECVLIWGPRHQQPGDWILVHKESLVGHGSINSVAWAPAEHGAIVACACADGTVAVVSHAGAVRTSHCNALAIDPVCAAEPIGPVEHRWDMRTFQAHDSDASAVSWASPPSAADGVGFLGLAGARLTSAGADGVSVWGWDESRNEWLIESIDVPSDLKVTTRDVVWKPWDGIAEMIASVSGQTIVIWRRKPSSTGGSVGKPSSHGSGRWHPEQRVSIGREAWKLSWADVGGLLMVSCGESDQTVLFLKQQLAGAWDVMDMTILGA